MDKEGLNPDPKMAADKAPGSYMYLQSLASAVDGSLFC